MAEKPDHLEDFFRKRFADPLGEVGDIDHEGFVFGAEPEDEGAED